MEFTVQVKVADGSRPPNGAGPSLRFGPGGPAEAGFGSPTAPVAARAAREVRGLYVVQVRMRSQINPRGVRVLLNGATCDPQAYQVAIMALSAVPVAYDGHRWAVLGDMEVLGDDARQAHREIGRFCAEHFLDRVIGVGGFAGELAAGALDGGLGEDQVAAFRTSAQTLQYLSEQVRPGDVVLVKGSTEVEMDLILDGILGA